VPTIAKVNGDAVGAGLSVVMLSDFAYAGEDAEFSAAFVNLGLIPDTASTVFLQQFLGLRDALDIALSGRSVPAAEAEAMGLLNEAVPAESLDGRVETQIDRLSALPTPAIATTRNVLHANAARTWQEGLDYENLLQAVMTDTDVHRAAVKIIRENT